MNQRVEIFHHQEKVGEGTLVDKHTAMNGVTSYDVINANPPYLSRSQLYSNQGYSVRNIIHSEGASK